MVPEGLGNWIRRRAYKSRNFTAIIFRDQEITYEALSQRIDRLAAALRDRGVRKGDRVAYLGGNHPSFVESMFATTLLGAIFVPLNTRLSVPELEFQLRDSGTTVFIHTANLAEPATAASAALDIRRIVVNDPPVADAGSEDFESVIASAPEQIPFAEPRVWPPRLAGIDDEHVTLDDPALIIYTSGTTGQPKGAVLTHGNLTWNSLTVITDYDVTSESRWLLISPLFHVASLGMGLLPTLLKGATVLLQERFVPGEVLAAIEELRATHLSGVPTTYQLLVEDPAWETADISSLLWTTCGGSAVPAKIAAAYDARGLALSNGYGMTEASPGVAMLPPWEAMPHIESSGIQMYFAHFRIRDPETGAIVGPGHAGEIEVTGPNVMVGYWNRPDANAEAFTEDGWFRTGDIGFADEGGFLTIVDRVKDMMISGGENVYSVEVEQVIATLPGVTGVAVLARPDERWGEVPHAVVSLAPGAQLDVDTMIGALRERLAGYKIPRSLQLVEEFPRTASGKIQKVQLKEQLELT